MHVRSPVSDEHRTLPPKIYILGGSCTSLVLLPLHNFLPRMREHYCLTTTAFAARHDRPSVHPRCSALSTCALRPAAKAHVYPVGGTG